MSHQYKRRTFDEAQALALRTYRSLASDHLAPDELQEVREHGTLAGGSIGDGWQALIGHTPEERKYYEFQLYRPSSECPYIEKYFARILVTRDRAQEVIEETYFREHPDLKAESDKAWDAMHRTLADGQLTWDGGEYPLSHVVLAGELLYTDSDYIMSLKTPEQVRDIAAELPAVTETEFRRRYFAIDAKSYNTRCQRRILVTLGIGFRASATFTPERPKRDALFCLRLTNDDTQQTGSSESRVCGNSQPNSSSRSRIACSRPV